MHYFRQSSTSYSLHPIERFDEQGKKILVKGFDQQCCLFPTLIVSFIVCNFDAFLSPLGVGDF